MTMQTTDTRSRRAILAASLGGLVAVAAGALGRAVPVRAANGDAVTVGGSFTGTLPTQITNTAVDSAAIRGINSAAGGQGLYGQGSGVGVQGHGTIGPGVHGDTDGSFAGVEGYGSTGGTGVAGYSNGGSAAPPKTGVFGNAELDSASRGVYGLSPAGHGLHGKTSTGYAGFFEGRVYTTRYYELTEIGTPGAPLSNRARLFVRDNGSGSTQLCVKFHNGVVRVLATS